MTQDRTAHLQKAGARLYITGRYTEEMAREYCRDNNLDEAETELVLVGYGIARDAQAGSLRDITFPSNN